MSKRGPENVLLLVPPELVSRLATGLAGVAGRVWISAAELPPQQRMDVVVIDGASDRTAAAATPLSGAGIVAIGHDPAERAERCGPAADVVLAPDFTDRELRMTVRLVARLARLRAELAAGARREAEVRQLADTDPLTGLANRRAWERYLETIADEPDAPPRWLAVVDLDHFKQVNDSQGMAHADEVLRRTAQVLAAQLRRGDLIARLGGDEFGVVLCHVSAHDVHAVFERLRTAVVAACAGSDPVTASIGYVPFEATKSAGQVLAAAERAMRVAKQMGGDRAISGTTG